MGFGTWNVTSHYRAGSLTAAARELARYKIHLLRVQEVRWDKESTVIATDYNFFYVKKMKINWEQEFCTPQNRISSSESRVC